MITYIPIMQKKKLRRQTYLQIHISIYIYEHSNNAYTYVHVCKHIYMHDNIPITERKKLRRHPEDAERVKNTKILL
jgi:hypothetical protein